MEIVVAESAGFCYGVKRAVNMAVEGCNYKNNVYTLGEIIHNKSMTSRLEEKGIKNSESLDEIPDGAVVIIRAHGVGRDVYERLKGKGCRIVDATCPHVAKIHRIAETESSSGRMLVVIGTHNHPEVVGISGWCSSAAVIESREELNRFISEYSNVPDLKISVVSQTTSSKIFYDECKEALKNVFEDAKIFDTVCNATEKRQSEAEALSGRVDAMIVVGDKTSSNSKHLAETCSRFNRNVFFVESSKQLDTSQLEGFSRIGVTAGASVPDWLINDVIDKAARACKKNF